MSISQLTRQGSIEGKGLWVFDDLVEPREIAALTTAFDNGAFTRNEIARPETAQYKHWALNVALEVAQQLPIHRPMLDALATVAPPGVRHRAYRAYCNYAAYGDVLFTHTDALPGSTELTALWFIAREWNVEWGGETLFFNSRQDAEFVVSPRPGRLCIFDGTLLHCGRPPSRICFSPRYTFAYKLERY
jgi:SM-20-related protein